MEEQEKKEEFRQNLLRLVHIEDLEKLYRTKLDGVEQQLCELDMRRYEENSVKTTISIAKCMQALQYISDVICTKLSLVYNEKKDIESKLLLLAPNGIMDDGYYSAKKREVQENVKINEQEIIKKEFIPTSDDLKIFETVCPGQDIKEMSAKTNMSQAELIKVSKDYITYLNEHTKKQTSDEEMTK